MTETLPNAKATEPSRAPIRAPEGDVADKAEGAPVIVQPKERPPVKMLGISLPGSISDSIHRLQDWGKRTRKHAIEKTPTPIVNSSTNIIGSMQVVGDLLMFRSSGLHLVRPKIDPIDPSRNRKPIHYLTDPFVNIYGGVFKKEKIDVKNLSPEKTIFNGDFYKALPSKIKESFASLKDLEKATLRDRTHTAPMYNKWSARAGFAGVTGMTIAMLLPDKKDTPEETRAMTKMSKEHPVKYAAMRLGQAVNPLGWINNKRQFAGFGMTLAGIFSVVSGFRQVQGKFTQEMIEAGVKNTQKYMRNDWQIAGGLITTMGGSQLLFAVDNDSGWRNFGVTQMVRLATLPAAITTRFSKTEQGAEWYLASQAVFQAKNVFAASVGGAKKDKNGNVINQDAVRAEARQAVKAELAEKKASHKIQKEETHKNEQSDPSPGTQVMAAHKLEKAMPERAEEHYKAQTEAAVM